MALVPMQGTPLGGIHSKVPSSLSVAKVPLGQSVAAAKVSAGIHTPRVVAAPIAPVAWQVEFGLPQAVWANGSQSATQAGDEVPSPKHRPLRVSPK